MTRLEDAQCLPGKFLAGINRGLGEFIDQPARTGLTDAAGAEIVSGSLGIAFRNKSAIDHSVDPGSKWRGVTGRAPIDAARSVVQVEHVGLHSKGDIAGIRLAAHGGLEPVHTGLNQTVDVLG